MIILVPGPGVTSSSLNMTLKTEGETNDANKAYSKITNDARFICDETDEFSR